ncbi:MAG: glycosyltransferase family 2 protein [Janthinobacterium lividum]
MALRAEIEVARARSLQLEIHVQQLIASRSWRLTSPVRWAGRRARDVRTLLRVAGLVARDPAKLSGISEMVSREWKVSGLRGAKKALSLVANGPVAAEPAHHIHFLDFSDRLGRELREDMGRWPRQPKISILMPTYNTATDVLQQAVDSVRAQIYENWELCIGDDCSTDPQVRKLIDACVASDARIKVVYARVNSGVSSTTNRALEIATGEFVALMDHDDLLEKQAIYRIAEAVVADDPDFIYSDEVIVAADGRNILGFAYRPQFSLEYLRSHPYIVHMIAFRASLLRELGGLDTSLSISQDYDLIFRAIERARKIVHIPEILYRWRTQPDSSGHQQKDRVMESSRKVLAAHLARTRTPGEVSSGPAFNFFDVRYPLQPGLKVAIVIPTKNHGALVRQCIESIERTASGIDYEIVLVDHDSNDPESLAYFDSIRGKHVVLNYSGPFNFSAINNWATRQITPDFTHYLFCNNDIEALEQGWLGRMLELAQRPETGAVGAKLLYPGEEVCQHAGVGVGLYGAAEHYGKFMKVHLPDGSIEQGYMGGMIVNREMSAVTAACVLIRRDVFLQVDGYDERLAVGFGDVDLCLRIRAAGYLVMFCAHALLIHHESISRGKSATDPHPEDSALFKQRWSEWIESGDPYFNPRLSSTSTRWATVVDASPKRELHRRVVSPR